MSIHTIEYSRDVLYVDAAGVSFENITTAEIVTNITISSNSLPSPTKLIEFDVPWLVEPVTGDVIKYRYNALGLLNFQADTTVELLGVNNTVINKNVAGSIKFTTIFTNLVSAPKSIFSSTGNTFHYMYLNYVNSKHYLGGSVFGATINDLSTPILEDTPYEIELFWGAGTGSLCGIKINGITITTDNSGSTNFTGNIIVNGDINATLGIVGQFFDFKIFSTNFTDPIHEYKLREGVGTVANDTGSIGGKDGVVTFGGGSWLAGGSFTDSDTNKASGDVVEIINCSG